MWPTTADKTLMSPGAQGKISCRYSNILCHACSVLFVRGMHLTNTITNTYSKWVVHVQAVFSCFHGHVVVWRYCSKLRSASRCHFSTAAKAWKAYKNFKFLVFVHQYELGIKHTIQNDIQEVETVNVWCWNFIMIYY